MTAQIKDNFSFNGKLYKLGGIEGVAKLFSIEESCGIDPDFIYMVNPTCCHRGYIATYEIENNRLKINSISMYSDRIDLPKDLFLKYKYVEDYKTEKFKVYGITCEETNIYINFTGSIFIVNDYIRGYTVSCMLTEIYEFGEVIELVFNNGTLVNHINHSELCKQIRYSIDKIKEIDKDYWRKNIKYYIEDKFKDDFEKNKWWIIHNFEDKRYLNIIY